MSTSYCITPFDVNILNKSDDDINPLESRSNV